MLGAARPPGAVDSDRPGGADRLRHAMRFPAIGPAALAAGRPYRSMRRRLRNFLSGAARAVPLASALFGAAPGLAAAQALRGSASSTAHYIELRPLRVDTVPFELVVPGPNGEPTFGGLPVACEADFCVVYRSGEVEHALSATHEADFTMWGLGVEGLSATFLARARTHLDGEFRLPLTDDPIEAVLAYAQLVRGAYRFRVGRQRELSGLGFAGFDGVDVLYEPRRTLRAQVYGGRSLARNVQQPLARAFRDVDERDFVRGRDAYLLGGELAVEPAGGSTVALRYQAEIWEDRAGFISERALLIGRTTAVRPLVVAASAEFDVGFGRFGKAQLDVEYPLPALGLRVEATLRRYLPFFEYWTIWGLFSPVAYHEAELRSSWSATPQMGVWASAAYRRYAAHNTQTFLRPLEGESVRAAAGAEWRIPEVLRFDAAARVEGSVGAFSIGADAAVQWRATSRIDLTLHAALLQQIEEFHVGAGVLGGGGVGADVQLRGDLRMTSGFELYRQTHQDRPGRPDWTQRRAWLSLRLDVGSDPGLAGREEP